MSAWAAAAALGRRALARLSGRGDGEPLGLGRWLVLSVLIGIVAGAGAIALQWGIDTVNHVALAGLGGYAPPGLPTEGGELAERYLPQYHWWRLMLVPALGGLVTGLIVYTLAPEAEGHGTDAMIRAFHREGGYIRPRVPIIKIVASAITLGTGGSGGREGPIAQIGSGFGSWLATTFRVSDYERRIMVLAGAAGGIGAIFRAPLGGALVVCELLYRNMEFEHDAVIPAVLTSVVAYTIYSLVNGWAPMFQTSTLVFDHPENLLVYLVLGVCVAGLGWLYVKVFYGMRDRVFARLPIPRHFVPMIGGLLTGLVALVAPQAISLGYGWVQLGMLGRLHFGDYVAGALGKIVATAFTISSGGSGGVFGPAVVIGGFTGGAVGSAFAHLLPGWHLEPQAFILVGMAAFFGGAAKAPIGALLMISEMTSGYGLLVPLMLTCAIAVMLVPRDVSIYEEQVAGMLESPAHFGRYITHVLATLRDRGTSADATAAGSVGAAEAARVLGRTSQELFPVADPEDPGRIRGLVSRTELEKAVFTGRATNGQSLGELQLASLRGVGFLDAEVQEGSPIAGRRVGEIEYGGGVLPVAVRSGEATTVATRETRLAVGDHVILIATPGRAEAVLAMFRRATPG
jgi:CIC family chloride channel protein